MAKCLVTGGAGFIGSHLISRLLCDNHHIVALDQAPWNNSNNLFNLNSSAFKYVQGSVSDSSLFRSLITDADHIYLLAATLGVRRVIENPIGTANTQVDLLRIRKDFMRVPVRFMGKQMFHHLPKAFPWCWGNQVKQDGLTPVVNCFQNTCCFLCIVIKVFHSL
jgi:UDP-glucose 4-epimerase